jgi:cytochrome c-type biogenesis protein CcmE
MNERRRRVILTVIALVVSTGVLAYLAFGGIGENLVYYWSPSELRDSGEQAIGANIRLGGLVEPGSIERDPNGLSLRFSVTDGTESVRVAAQTVPPAMFREGIGVVVEGTMGTDGWFETQRLMVKHDNEYAAPGEGDELDMKELMKSMQFDETDA